MADDRQISKSLSYWLRHNPTAGNLTLDPSGWAECVAILDALFAAKLPHEHSDLLRVVEGSDKNRFEISADGSLIRARQGHSIAVDLDWPRATPPEFLFHGTVERFLQAILSEGLKPMARHHVHLSPDENTAKIVGARRGKPVILRIAADALSQAGKEFRLAGNGVWLTDHVPPSHIERL
ncbi:RNA 2'-phosphotransferase [Sphingopyxis sp.]|uniref:RNA 2'-phosphotransferase n=1 Tax=Sphingopyxis sp. TaxID=1908224 RepID=UPI0010F90B28|nr:RNA 2'-phosphotransferase [Sphingopyxis sp.]MBR2171902.1 RNA 2'-phosphotransferase [Sphingopyxis sp.]